MIDAFQSNINPVKDSSFLKQLDEQPEKTFYTKIIVLGKLKVLNSLSYDADVPIRSIEGRVKSGSISINGASAVRRAGSISFVAEEEQNDLTDIDNLLSMNKKIKILIGIENYVNNRYPSIVWFNLGIFVISNPSISHNSSSVDINLQLKDKMALLNGDCGGNLPTSVTFDSYNQTIGYLEIADWDGTESDLKNKYPENPNNYTIYGFKNKTTEEVKYLKWDSTTGWEDGSYDVVGNTISVPQRIFDIIQTLVCNYGGEAIENIVINDVVLELKSLVRYIGSDSLYYNAKTGKYTLNAKEASSSTGELLENWVPYSYNEDCGYIYTDFTYPGSLVSSIGDNVVTILDKIKNALGNYEYFYDVDGRFIFQEKKNYLNTTYDPVEKIYDVEGISTNKYTVSSKGEILNNETCILDLSNTSSSIYTFAEGSGLISSYSNTPNYENIKNDFHIWGKNKDGLAIHYHLVIKEKPTNFNSYKVVYLKNKNNEYTGKLRLATPQEIGNESAIIDEESLILSNSTIEEELLKINISNATVDNDTLVFPNGAIESYTPSDWRAELYMRGLTKQQLHQRPDIYEQEILDLFDSIYNMKEKKFKEDISNNANNLTYWIDYINPKYLEDISVDSIGTKMYSYQKDNIIKLYNNDVPNKIIINTNATDLLKWNTKVKCDKIGQSYSYVTKNVYDKLAIGTAGYTAQEVARDLLYQYTNFSSSISLSSIPIYYLEPNCTISVFDRAAGIAGDYTISSISLPLDMKDSMTISAAQALKRI